MDETININTGSAGGSATAANTNIPNMTATPQQPTAITPESMTTQTPINIQNPAPVAPKAPVNLADKILQETAVEETATQKEATSLTKSLNELIPMLSGQAQTLADEEAKAGVGTLKQGLQNINNAIIQKQAELEQSDVQLIANMRAEERRDTLLPFAQSSQAKLAGDAAIMRALKSSEIGVLNAQALAAQGNIALAMDTAQKAVELKYAPYKEQIAIYQAQLKALEPLLNADEKKQARAQEIKTKLALNEIDQEEAREKSIYNISFEAAKNGAPASVISQINKAKNLGEAIQLTAGYLAEKKYQLSDGFVFDPATGSVTTPVIPGPGSGVLVSKNPNPNEVFGEFDLTTYATDPAHGQKISALLARIGEVTSQEDLQNAIKQLAPNAPVTASMIMNSATKFNVDPGLMLAVMINDSSLGTKGKGARTFNPGNVGNDDAGNIRNYGSWQAGVDAVAGNLNKRRIKNAQSTVKKEDVKLTEGERKAYNFYQRGSDAAVNIQTLEKDIENMKYLDLAKMRRLPEEVQTGIAKQQIQAERQFIEAYLRKDSGAAIPPEEYKAAQKTLFPQPGDTPAVLTQKKRARQVYLEGLKSESGNAFVPTQYDLTVVGNSEFLALPTGGNGGGNNSSFFSRF